MHAPRHKTTPKSRRTIKKKNEPTTDEGSSSSSSSNGNSNDSEKKTYHPGERPLDAEEEEEGVGRSGAYPDVAPLLPALALEEHAVRLVLLDLPSQAKPRRAMQFVGREGGESAEAPPRSAGLSSFVFSRLHACVKGEIRRNCCLSKQN